MRAHKTPQLYQRAQGGSWWCYWRDDRWSTKTSNYDQASRIVRDRYDPRVATAREKGIEDAILLLYDALERRGRSKATKGQARQKLGHFARLWRGRSLASIDWSAMREYIRTRLEVDLVTKSDAAEPKHVSRVTVSHELGYLRQAWQLAHAEGWVSKSWKEIMPERFDRKYKPRKRWLPLHELAAVLGELPEHQAAVVAWLVATGSDVGDVARARPEDIDWKRKLVRVRGTKNFFRDRQVPITTETRELLRFAEKHGPPFEPWPGINLQLRRIAVRLGIEHFSPKDLRRTHGFWLRHAGVTTDLIGRVLGHADSKMADEIYGVGEDEAIAELVRAAVSRRPKRRASVHGRSQSPDVVRMYRKRTVQRQATG